MNTSASAKQTSFFDFFSFDLTAPQRVKVANVGFTDFDFGQPTQDAD